LTGNDRKKLLFFPPLLPLLAFTRHFWIDRLLVGEIIIYYQWFMFKNMPKNMFSIIYLILKIDAKKAFLYS